MKGRSQSGQRLNVAEARAVVQQALGETAKGAVPTEAKYVPAAQVAERVRVKEDTQYVLTLGEVAARLGTSRTEVERLIAAGKLTALPTGFTVTVPTSEVERLQSERI